MVEHIRDQRRQCRLHVKPWLWRRDESPKKFKIMKMAENSLQFLTKLDCMLQIIGFQFTQSNYASITTNLHTKKSSPFHQMLNSFQESLWSLPQSTVEIMEIMENARQNACANQNAPFTANRITSAIFFSEACRKGPSSYDCTRSR